MYAVSDELDESSLSSESELEVDHPSVLQEDQLDQLSLFLSALKLQRHKSVKLRRTHLKLRRGAKVQ